MLDTKQVVARRVEEARCKNPLPYAAVKEICVMLLLENEYQRLHRYEAEAAHKLYVACYVSLSAADEPEKKILNPQK